MLICWGCYHMNCSFTTEILFRVRAKNWKPSPATCPRPSRTTATWSPTKPATSLEVQVTNLELLPQKLPLTILTMWDCLFKPGPILGGGDCRHIWVFCQSLIYYRGPGFILYSLFYATSCKEDLLLLRPISSRTSRALSSALFDIRVKTVKCSLAPCW